MKSKKELLKRPHLYAIVDKKICGKRPLLNIARIIKDAGVDIIQFRDKKSQKESVLEDARALQKKLVNTKTIFIINDYLDIAKIVNSEGVHLGQDDISIEIARKILGKDKIIGISCHNLREALNAQHRGADYISIGPLFPTTTKPEYKGIGLGLIKKCKKKLKIPFFGIGGINENNIKEVLSSGIKRVAICSAICQSKNISVTTRNFTRLLY